MLFFQWTYKRKKPPKPGPGPDLNTSDKDDFQQKLKQIEENSEKRIREIQDQFEKLQKQLLLASGSGKGKGPIGKGKGPRRGKTSTVVTTRSQHGTVQEYFGDLDNQSHISVTSSSTSESFVQIGASASSNCSYATRAQTEAFGGDEFEEHTVYLKKVELTLNGSPIDMIEDRQTEDHCIQSFWRMNQFCGFNNTPFSNGLSYDVQNQQQNNKKDKIDKQIIIDTCKAYLGLETKILLIFC